MTLGSATRESGFSLIEALVATTVLAVAVVSLGDLLVMAARANGTARATTLAATLAEQKMEQLKALPWTYDEAGARVSDFSSNVAASAATGACAASSTGAAVGLSPAPADALASNQDGYVDYVDVHGCELGGGTAPPPGAVYIRRWSIAPSDAGADTLVLQVLVTPHGLRSARADTGLRVRMPAEARLVGLKTRRMP